MANSVTAAAINTANDEQADALQEDLQTFHDEIVELIKEDSYAFPVINMNTAPVDAANIVGRVDTIQAPNDYSFGAFSKPAPDAPTFDSIVVPDFGPIPELIISAPVINMPVAPNANLPGAPGAAPTFNAPAVPDTPTFTLPDVPTFANIVIPPVPSYSIPVYNTVFPDDDLLAPSFTFDYDEQVYQSNMLDALKVELIDNLLNGGYGINTADEQALWERTREREMLAAETTIQQATANAAARGFPMPPGALLALIEGAQQSALEKISSINRDIALKRADMYVENRKFTIQQVRDTEQMLINHFNATMERTLNAAKYVAELGRLAYDALVARFQARVAGAQAASQAYEIQLKAGLASLEAYKVEMEGANLAVKVQSLVAEVYRTQLSGVESFVNIYHAQIDGSKVLAELENLKLSAFRSSVEAYSAQVAAKSAEFGMYKAQLEGELSKVSVYKSQVEAHSVNVQAYATGATAKRTQLDAQIESSRLQLEAFDGQIKTYTTALQSDKIYLDSLLGKHQADTQRYSAKVQAQAAVGTASAAVSKANAEIVMAKAQVASSYATNTAHQLTSRASLSGDLATGMYKMYNDKIVAVTNKLNSIVLESAAT